MSTDPSPWAELSGIQPEVDRPTTAEMLAEFDQERRDEIRTSRQDAEIFNKFAHRLTRDGRLII